MNTSTSFSFRILLALAIGGALIGLALVASAQNGEDIIYPVAELGGCENKEACFTYCEDPENMEACVAFAEEHNLMDQEEIENAHKFISAGKVGPGNCQSQGECEAYCDNIANMDACLAFAEENGFMDPQELVEAKRVARALQQGAQLPGGCRDKTACEAYCNTPTHMDECLAFAEQAGLMEPEELVEAKKVAQALRSGARIPGDCRGKAECEAYCQEPTHMEECLAFGEAAGLISPEELEEARRIMPLMQSGQMPGGCTSREQCEAYCTEESHMEECMAFAVKAGFMTQEEAERAKQFGGKGPGDCKSREECEAFCNDAANQETCFAFGQEHGMVSEEDLHNMREGMQQLQGALTQAPPEVLGCLQDHMGTEIIEKIRAGNLTPGPQIGEQVKACFEQFMPGPGGSGGFQHEGLGGFQEGQYFEGGVMMRPGDFSGEFQGPGGCRSEAECQAYCSDPAHQAECGSFGGQQQGQTTFPPEQDFGVGTDGIFRGPAGCVGERECRAVCADPAYLDECHLLFGETPGQTAPLFDYSQSSSFPLPSTDDLQNLLQQPQVITYPENSTYPTSPDYNYKSGESGQTYPTTGYIIPCEQLYTIPSIAYVPPDLQPRYRECFPERI